MEMIGFWALSKVISSKAVLEFNSFLFIFLHKIVKKYGPQSTKYKLKSISTIFAIALALQKITEKSTIKQLS